MKPLSTIAISICEENYTKNCGSCPLRPVCVTGIGPGYEGLQRWQDNINAAAEEIAREAL